jgi:hypothetical protein
MKNPVTSTDPDMRGTWPALLRAAKKALKIARESGTPCYVLRDGRLVNLNPTPKRRKAAKR